MRPQFKAIIKLGAVALLVLAAVSWAIFRTASFRGTGEQNARVWFYDLSEKRLYAASPDIPPPDKGIGGKKDDAVRAVVISLRGPKNDPPSRRIAYLQTYTPELKRLLDRVRAARAAGRRFEGQIPARDSDFFQSNTLISSPNDANWQPSNTAQAQRIMSEWHSWRGPEGQLPVVIVP
jgi:hypothetical protein